MEPSNLSIAIKEFTYVGGALFFIILGVSILTGLMREYIPQKKLQDKLGKHQKFGAFFGAAFGLLTPFCSAAIVPVSMGMAQMGVSLGTIFGFLISAPLCNFVVVSMIFAVFGAKVAAGYFVVCFVGAVLAGFIVEKTPLRNEVKRGSELDESSAPTCGAEPVQTCGETVATSKTGGCAPQKSSTCAPVSCGEPVKTDCKPTVATDSCCGDKPQQVPPVCSEKKEPTCCGEVVEPKPQPSACVPPSCDETATKPSCSAPVVPHCDGAKPVQSCAAPVATTIQSCGVSKPVQTCSAPSSSTPSKSKPSCGEKAPESVTVGGCCGAPVSTGTVCHKEKFKAAMAFAWLLFKKIMPYVLVGTIISAISAAYLPADIVEKYVGGDNWYSIPIAAAIGIPLYLRIEMAIPLLNVLIAKGMGMGAAIALIIGGTGASLPEIALVSAVLKPRAVFAFVASMMIIAITGGILFTIFM